MITIGGTILIQVHSIHTLSTYIEPTIPWKTHLGIKKTTNNSTYTLEISINIHIYSYTKTMKIFLYHVI
jgi:hypothetical protein